MEVLKELLLVLVACVYITEGFLTPFTIVRHPVSVRYSLAGVENVKLDCEAEPADVVEYKWVKNNKALNLDDPNIDRQVYSASGGSIIIKNFDKEVEGNYQCFVNLKMGTNIIAMSRVATVTMTTGPSYTAEDRGKLERKYVNISDPLILTCADPKVVPSYVATYRWEVRIGIGPDTYILEVSDRMNIDDSGNLYFAYTLKDDGKDLYCCAVQNTVTSIRQSASYTNVTVYTGTTPANKPPAILFKSNAKTTVFQGERAKLRCFFSGYPLPSIHWKRADGEAIDQPRIEIQTFGSQLYFSEVRLTDDAQYQCIGRNVNGERQETITLSVRQKPVLIGNSFQTPIITVTEGGNATFKCEASAIPPAKVEWISNSNIISGSSYKYTISDSGAELTVKSVCKTGCNFGTPDTSVIQCNASNEFGYVLAQGFLNVLTKTVITTKPRNITVHNITDPAVFTCIATTDDTTHLTYTWRFNYNLIDTTNQTNYKVTGSSQLEVILPSVRDDLDKLLGIYTCDATNGDLTKGYTGDSSSAWLRFGPDPDSAGRDDTNPTNPPNRPADLHSGATHLHASTTILMLSVMLYCVFL